MNDEFDLQPDERKLTCGCYVQKIGDEWRVTGSAFLCPQKHNFYEALAPEIIADDGRVRESH
jgi:hypothetical protein